MIFDSKLNDIKLIEIEIYSYCNRKCSFCPNSKDQFRQDHKNAKFLDIDIFKKFIDTLVLNNYNGVISFSRYNEPLAFKEITKKYVDYVKNKLNVKTVSNTNGDYIDKDSLNIFDELTVMDYANKGKDWWIKKLTKLGAVFQNHINNEFLYFLTSENKKILVFLEFEKNATIEDRGGILNLEKIKLKPKNDWNVRQRPCLEPKKFLGIDYNGEIMPCCNLQSQYHPDFSLGNIHKDSIITVVSSKIRKKIIDTMSSSDYSKYFDVCRRCQKDPGRYTRDNPSIEYTNERR